jgi:hypothetical protein
VYVQKVPYKVTTVTKLAQRDVEKIFRSRVEDEGPPRESHLLSAAQYEEIV